MPNEYYHYDEIYALSEHFLLFSNLYISAQKITFIS